MVTKRLGMDDNRIMKQVGAIFSIFMVLFYLGVGIYLIFILDPNQSTLGKPIFVMFGSFCIFYGLYRAYATYISIVKLFFKPDDDDE